MTMDAQTGEVSGASVQIGDPITEKSLIDIIMQARDRQLYSDITDCGAGGLSSAVGEMASRIGADIELMHVPLKYPGLAPWEIWLSEAQERMVLAVPANNIPELKELCETFDTEMTDIGEITGSSRLIVRHSGQIVLNLANPFLHDGSPQQHLQASLPEDGMQSVEIKVSVPDNPPAFNTSMLLKLLAHPDIASKAATIRLYDHEIQGGTIIKPLTGIQNDGPSDAVVLKPIGTGGTGGIVISNGINPQFGKLNPGWMAWAVVDEAIRNAVCVGADPGRIALLDNFCWGDPKRPDTLAALVEAVRGCHDAALHYGTPFISGKDSLNNEYLGTDGHRHSIPPTLLISVLGMIENVSQAVSMDLKQAGNLIYLVGDFQPALSGSHYSLISGLVSAGDIPAPSKITPKVYHAFHQAIQSGLVASAHDLSEGGLAVCAAEMCIAGRLGMQLDIQGGSLQPDRLLFGETNGCLLAEVSLANADAFEELFSDLPIQKMGQTDPDGLLVISMDGETRLSLRVEELVNAWNPVGEGFKG
jgi:phosphoribosylformylglycinamidine synthase